MTLLSSTIDTQKLVELINESDKQGIAEFIYQRFSERYFLPIENLDKTEKHGFSIMAVSCLIVESFESYKKGWSNTRNKSELAFKQFFERESEFRNFERCSKEFYKNIRCGILHQSETTGGWKILRNGVLVDAEKKTVNATKFLSNLKQVLKNYCEHLKTSNWDSEDWDNLRRKLRQIIKNCES